MDIVNQILERRVEKVLPSKEGLKKLMHKRKIKLYQGFDATAANLHLGHSVGIRKLMDFANAGHEVIILFGTGTVLVGDPSQRKKGRKMISPGQVEKNIQSWKEQVSPLVDWNKVKILKNGDWLKKLKLEDIIRIASNISAVQLFKRDMFQRRIKKKDTVWYHETIYPLLQGYDSVYMDVDLEIGGTDQEFNMLIGRELMQKMLGKEKFVLTTPLIAGTDGKFMSKSAGNCIWLNDSHYDMFTKLMAIPDNQITIYMELVTNIPLNRIKEISKGLKDGAVHPLEAKKELASAVVKDLHGQEKVNPAREYFEKTFQKKDPEYKKTLKISRQETILDLVTYFVGSKSEAKRQIQQGAVDINGKTVDNLYFRLKGNEKVKVGKKIFVKLVK